MSTRKLKRIFHSPEVSNSKAKSIYRTVRAGLPMAQRLPLDLKYFYHRILRGRRYADAPESDRAEKLYLERIASASGPNRRDILLASHELTLTGGPRALLELALALKRLGYSPVIVSPRQGDISKELTEGGIPAIVDPLFFSDFPLIHDMRRRFVDTFPTVIFNTLIAILHSKIFTGLSSHTIGWVHEAEQFYAMTPIANGIREAFDALDEIWAVSAYCRDANIRNSGFAGQMDIVPFGLTLTSPEIKVERCITANRNGATPCRTFFFGGNIDHMKGAGILAEALELLAPGYLRHIKITLAGRPDDKKIVDRLKAFGPEVIKILGVIPHSEIMRLIGTSDAVLCTSLDESMSMICAEGLFMGKPVITTNHTGIATFITSGSDGIILPAGDAETLADCIRGCVDEAYDLDAIGRKGLSVFRRVFSPENFTRNIGQRFPAISPKE